MRVMSGYGQTSDANSGFLRDFLGCGSPVTGGGGFSRQEIGWQEQRQTILEFHPVTVGTLSSPLVPAPEPAAPPLSPKLVR